VHPLRALVLGSLFAAGCAARQPVSAAAPPPPEAFAVHLDARFTTTADGLAEVPWAAGAPEQLSLDLSLRLTHARGFRDGSTGRLVEVLQASRSVEGAAAPWGLEGRSFELRVFEGREILTADLVEHLAGPDRQLDALDLLLPVLAPFPPALEEGATAYRAVRWPLVLGPGRFARGEVGARWTHEGVEPLDGEAAIRIAYAGPWTTRLQDGRVQGRGEGEARGTAWFAVGSGALLRHDFDWSRSLELRYPDGPSGPVRVVQEQQVRGALRRVLP
jgi:hypothetical protein